MSNTELHEQLVFSLSGGVSLVWTPPEQRRGLVLLCYSPRSSLYAQWTYVLVRDETTAHVCFPYENSTGSSGATDPHRVTMYIYCGLSQVNLRCPGKVKVIHVFMPVWCSLLISYIYHFQRPEFWERAMSASTRLGHQVLDFIAAVFDACCEMLMLRKHTHTHVIVGCVQPFFPQRNGKSVPSIYRCLVVHRPPTACRLSGRITAQVLP